MSAFTAREAYEVLDPFAQPRNEATIEVLLGSSLGPSGHEFWDSHAKKGLVVLEVSRSMQKPHISHEDVAERKTYEG